MECNSDTIGGPADCEIDTEFDVDIDVDTAIYINVDVDIGVDFLFFMRIHPCTVCELTPSHHCAEYIDIDIDSHTHIYIQMSAERMIVLQ